jgi:hypothetical protein
MEGQQNHTNDEKEVDERARHAKGNESQPPKNNQNRRNDKQHDGWSLSSESLNAANDRRRPRRFNLLGSAYKYPGRETVQKGTVAEPEDRLERVSFCEKRASGLRPQGNSSTLTTLSAESPHLTRYRLLQLLFKF